MYLKRKVNVGQMPTVHGHTKTSSAPVNSVGLWRVLKKKKSLIFGRDTVNLTTTLFSRKFQFWKDVLTLWIIITTTVFSTIFQFRKDVAQTLWIGTNWQGRSVLLAFNRLLHCHCTVRIKKGRGNIERIWLLIHHFLTVTSSGRLVERT